MIKDFHSQLPYWLYQLGRRVFITLYTLTQIRTETILERLLLRPLIAEP